MAISYEINLKSKVTMFVYVEIKYCTIFLLMLSEWSNVFFRFIIDFTYIYSILIKMHLDILCFAAN